MKGDISVAELDILIHKLMPGSPREGANLLDELDLLYYLKTGEHLEGNLRKRLKRGLQRNREALLEALVQIAEKDIKAFKLLAKKYPKFRSSCQEKISRLEEFIKQLKDC